MIPENFRVANTLTVSTGNLVVTSGQLVIGATAINATSLNDSSNAAYTNAIVFAANADNISSGTVDAARLGSGTANTTTWLRGDGSWQVGPLGYTGSQGPQGVIGYTGSQGIQGVIGYTGSQGPQGVIGYTGSRGDTGFTGSQGTQGVIGYTGSKGDQGVIGYTGSKGDQGVIGYTGSQGPQGVIGYTGSQGPTVYPGAGIAVSTGSAWTTSKTAPTGAVVGTTDTQTLTNKTLTSPILNASRSAVTAVAASNIDCSVGSYFTKTASGALSWTVTNVPATGAFSFILELTNGGTDTQTWFTGTKWPGGTAPTLTASGVDMLGFITDDGGTTWRGVQLMKDSK